MLSRSQVQDDPNISNLLADYVDGVGPLDQLLAQYNGSYHQINELVDLADNLRDVLVEVSPSPVFVERL